MVMNSSWFCVSIQAICYVNFQINRDYNMLVASSEDFYHSLAMSKLCVLVLLKIRYFTFLVVSLKTQVIILFEYKFQL